MLVGGLLWLAFAGVIIYLFVSLVTDRARRAESPPPPTTGGPADDAVEIVRHRYAAGEITKDQFQTMVDDLRQDGRSPTPPRGGQAS